MQAKVVCVGRGLCIKPFTLALCLFGSLSQTAIAEDDYLSLISSEAQKVDMEQSSSAASSSNPEAVQPDDAKLKAFEQGLKDQYKGSYFVYMRLSEASKRSLYQDHVSGVSYDEIRKKILTLYANHQ